MTDSPLHFAHCSPVRVRPKQPEPKLEPIKPRKIPRRGATPFGEAGFTPRSSVWPGAESFLDALRQQQPQLQSQQQQNPFTQSFRGGLSFGGALGGAFGGALR